MTTADQNRDEDRAAARRFLHVCYSCADASRTTAFFVDILGLHPRMRTGPRINSGAQLGIPRPVECDVAFLYDGRGARTSPAIEVQGWINPSVTGSAYPRREYVGIQALGFSVDSVEQLRPQLRAAGAVETEGLPAGTVVSNPRTECWRDPDGVAVDLVEEGGLAHGARIRHVRITCRDLDVAVGWYLQLGFEEQGRTESGEVRSCSLRLADEPCQLLLTQWLDPPSEGTGYGEANHLGWYRFAVGVDALDASYRELRAAGWVFTDPPRATALEGTPLPDLWIAFTRDPDGIPVELVERPRAAFR